MIEAWAEKLAAAIKNQNERETASVNVMKYALIIVINFLIPYTSALLIGLLTGKPAETALSVAALIAVRACSGGYHFRSSTACTVVTTIAAAVPPHLPLPDAWTAPATAIGFLLFALFAPANIKGYARMPEKYFPLMKLASLIIAGANFLLQSPTVAVILLLQGVTLLIPNKEVRT